MVLKGSFSIRPSAADCGDGDYCVIVK
jgi:hypothetical protein